MDIYLIGEEKSLFSKYKSSSIEDCLVYLNSKTEIGLDIETTRKYNKYGSIEGLDPYTSNIVMFQIGDLDRQYIVDARNFNLSVFNPILENENITKVGHNLVFEYKHLLHTTKVRLANIYDTMLAEQCIFNGHPTKKYGLANVINYYFNEEVDKSTRLEFLNIGSKPFSSKQLQYGADDITYPLRIKERQQAKINLYALEECINLENEFALVTGDIEYNGMHFNKEKWLKLYDKNLIRFKSLELSLNDFIINHYPNSKFMDKQLSLFETGTKVNVKWTSSKQVVNVFKTFNGCPEKISKSTGKLSPTVNATVLKSTLNTINKEQPTHIKEFIKLYLVFKETEQSCTTFGKDFLKYINPITNRIHTHYKQIIATGRMSSNNPNLQNIPAVKEYRECFDAPTNCKIVNADYTGQETVVLANKSKEPNIVKLILEGGCMHCFVAKAIDPSLQELSDDEIKKDHKDKRQVAKAAGFAIQYGGTGFTIATNLGIPQQEGDKVYEAYFKAFPQLRNYFKTVKALAKKRGYIRIDHITNRKYTFLKPNNNKEQHAIDKKALNYPIQGTSGSITKYAAILFREWLLENDRYKIIKITNIVHDEINLEVKVEYANLAAKHLERCMEQAGEVWCKLVPLKAKAAITNYWSH
jgi:DNA polymerase I